ncbi:peroxidase family protein [Anatilimnocola floriformis]|uniref:peroxidase family protein n=1 Tax=Anatilimnocola floriformis TaxID=2948575 RepID=UPI0020C2BDEF|nr:peroxidase family protein [Anatilimnocola floriformis]
MFQVSWFSLTASKKSQARAAAAEKIKQRRLFLEGLETRTLMAADIRSFDGTGNNLTNPEWGSTGEQFIRKDDLVAYGDGVSTPAGADRPSARVISNTLANEGSVRDLDERGLSAMMYAWGQFIDHDLDLTNTATPAESFAVKVPTGDAYFDPNGTGTQTISLTRSQYDPTTGTDTSNPREQVTSITSWIDGSMIYGSDDATAASLREFAGGRMLQGEDGLLPTDATGFFMAGDVRANENPELSSLQTLFVREHNRVAADLAQKNPTWTDEQLYQAARNIVIGEVQVITYKEWLPTLLGTNAIRPYKGYDATVNPSIANEFATAAFRLGHSMLGDDIEFLDNNGEEVRDEVSLAEAFFNPTLIEDNNIDPILKYLASDPSSKIDNQVVGSVRNFLFGPPGAGGLDLASLNIQRGRDHGLADYNSLRAAYGLPKVANFAQITSDPLLQGKLQSLYGTVDNIDAWVGMLAEDHVRGASVGPLVQRVIADQFSRVRDGDRFWYQRSLSGKELQDVEKTTLADVIRRNTNLTNVQQNVFVFKVEISGRVVNDANADSLLTKNEPGLKGRTVELVDSDTLEVIAQATTDPAGRYRFDVQSGLGLGEYTVREVTPSGWTETAAPKEAIRLTRGDQRITEVNFGQTQGTATTPTTPTPPTPPAPPPPPPPTTPTTPTKPTTPTLPPAPPTAPQQPTTPPTKPTPPPPPPTAPTNPSSGGSTGSGSTGSGGSSGTSPTAPPKPSSGNSNSSGTRGIGESVGSAVRN